MINLLSLKGLLLSISIFLFHLMLNAQQPTGSTTSLQNKQIDSLLFVIKNSDEDIGKINKLYELGLLLDKFHRNDELLKYGTEVLSLSRKMNNKKGIGLSYYLLSLYYYNQTNYTEALKNIFSALDILEEVGDKKNCGRCSHLIADIFFYEGKYPESIEYYKTTLRTLEETGEKTKENLIYNNLGRSSSYLGNYSQSLEYYYKALHVSEELGDKKGMAYSLQFIGSTYLDQNDDSIGLKNIFASRKINVETGDKFGYAQNNNAIAELYLHQAKYSDALQNFLESLKIYGEPGAPLWGIPWCFTEIGTVFEGQGDSALAAGNKTVAETKYKEALRSYFISVEKYGEQNDIAQQGQKNIYIGRVYMKLKKIPEAKKYFQKGIQTFTGIGSKQEIADSYLYLSMIDSVEGNYAKAYKHFKLSTLYRDSVFNTEESRKIAAYKTQYEFEKKDQEIKLLSAENKLNTTIAEKQKQQKVIAYVTVVFLFGLGVYGFYRYRSRKKMEMERTKLKDRLNISQGLHDDIGSTLSSISVYSQVAKVYAEKNEKEELSEMLGKIGTTSNEMVSEMNDIVWAIHPKNDSMEKIVQRMESYAKPLLVTRNISFKLEYGPSIFPCDLEMEKRKNFYLVFKEAVNNAFKYSGCSEIVTVISNSNGRLEMKIKDNGVGFDLGHEMSAAKMSLSGNGLKNMQLRAEQMKGKLTIESAMEKGTEVTLTIPIP